jgi:hypothetical protein
MHNVSKRSLIAALAVTAAAAPSTASAKFIVNDPVSGSAPIGQAVSAGPRQTRAAPASSGAFDWADAGIGAAAAVALLGGGTLVLGDRRRRGQAARAA